MTKMHVVRFRIQDSCFKILTEHEDTKAQRSLTITLTMTFKVKSERLWVGATAGMGWVSLNLSLFMLSG